MKLVGSFTYTTTPVDLGILANVDELRAHIARGHLFDDFTPNFHVSQFDYEKQYKTSYLHIQLPTLNYPGSGASEYRAAIGRMVALRAPERPGFSDRLARNQETIARQYRVPLYCFKLHLEEKIDRRTYEAEYPEWLFRPCAKRKMRLATDSDMNMFGNDCSDDLLDVEYKLKPGELLAQGKKRAVADLGVLRTQATAWAFDTIKAAWAEPFEFGCLRAVYVKTSTKENLRDAFTSLLDPGDKIQFMYHSDDSCVSAMCADGLVYFNGDIKACDGSHRRPVIELLRKLLREHKGVPNCTADAIDRALDYLSRDLVMRNQHDRRQKVKYKFRQPRLYSGSVVTTTLNNLANLLIAIALQKRVPDPRQVCKAEFVEAYRLAGEDVGYILKVISCDVPEDLQFLKHSPCLDGVEIEPWMNLGTFVRGFGSTKVGDLPGRGPVRERALKHMSGVIQGRLNWGDHVLNDAFKACAASNGGMKSPGNTREAEEDHQKSVGVPTRRVSTESLCRRYRLTVDELEDFCSAICSLQPGSYLVHPVASQLYTKDYG